MVSSTINHIVNVMRERRRKWMKFTVRSRGLHLPIQCRDLWNVSKHPALLRSFTHHHIKPALWRRGLSPSFYIPRSFSPERWAACSRTATEHNKWSEPMPCPKDTLLYTLATHFAVFPSSIFLPLWEVALGRCFRSSETLRGPMLVWTSESWQDDWTAWSTGVLHWEQRLWHPRKNSIREWLHSHFLSMTPQFKLQFSKRPMASPKVQ